MDTEAPMSTKALKKNRKEKPILVLDILVLVICSRCPPRRSVCWFLRWDYFDSLTMDSRATHPREFSMWDTVLHRIYLSHLSFLTDLPEELLSNQHSSFVWLTVGLCIPNYVIALHLHTDVWVFSALFVFQAYEIGFWSSCFLLVIVALSVSAPALSHSSLLALLLVAFNLHLPMKTEAAVD